MNALSPVSQWTVVEWDQHYREVRARLHRHSPIKRYELLRISEQMAKAHALLDQYEYKSPCVNTLRVQKAVCAFYRVSIGDLVSECRLAKLTRARHVAIFLTREFTPLSLPQIGLKFGGRDHTTVLHAIRKIDALSTVDENLRDEIEAIKILIGRKQIGPVEPLQG